MSEECHSWTFRSSLSGWTCSRTPEQRGPGHLSGGDPIHLGGDGVKMLQDTCVEGV